MGQRVTKNKGGGKVSIESRRRVVSSKAGVMSSGAGVSWKRIQRAGNSISL